MILGMYHPWRRFRAAAAWTLCQADLPDHLHGLTYWPTLSVVLNERLTQTQRRCTICHELVHIERGPVPDDDWLAAREESTVEREVARRLIELQPLGEALAWSRHISEAADVLWVTEDVLRARLDCLQPSERIYLDARLAFRHECEETT